MCSFSWRDFGTHIAIAFNRDESVQRAKAQPPKLFDNGDIKYLMPIDPDAGGSWIAVNELGFVFALLNNYQAELKPKTAELQSRGTIIKRLALCKNYDEVCQIIEQLDLELLQPFSLLCISSRHKSMWQYNGVSTSLTSKALPNHFFSSAHPLAEQVLRERNIAAESWSIFKDEDMLQLHRSHVPNNSSVEGEDRTFSICMHHDKGHTQSLSYIKLEAGLATMRYWNGQPCQTDQFEEQQLVIP